MLFPRRQSLSKRIARVWAERSFGLHQKFLLAFTGLVLGLIVSLLLIVESRQRASIIRQMEKRGVTIATQLAAVSTNSLLMYDFVALEQDAEKISRDQDVLYMPSSSTVRDWWRSTAAMMRNRGQCWKIP